MLYHRRWWVDDQWHFLQHAYLAVDFFFILSGLVVALAYEDRLADGRMRFGDFALLRAIRLYPLIVIGSLLGASYFGLRAFATGDGQQLLHTLMALPLSLLALPVPPALLDKPFALNEPAWSLFFELLANLAYALIAPRLSNRVLVALIVAFGAGLVGAALGQGGVGGGWEWGTMWIGAFRVGFCFLAGVGLYRWLRSGRMPRLRVPFWLLGVALVASFAPNLFPGMLNAAYDLALVLLVFPLIIVAGCNCAASRVWAPVMRVSGELSYPIYILHFPMLLWLEAVLWRLHVPNIAMLAIAAGIIAITALLSSRAYDLPVRRWLRGVLSGRPARG